MLIIPAIDLRAGRCVRLTQGRRDETKVYDSDPVAVAKAFEAAGAQMLHVVDLDGAFSETNAHNRQKLREIIGALKIPVQFGGGLRRLEDVETVLRTGTARVIIGTLAIESPEILATLVKSFGSDRIAVGIDAKAGKVMTRGWEREESTSALTLAQQVASLGVERIVYTDVTRDGMLQGVNLDATCAIARTSGLKVTASGGVSSLDDLRRIQAASACGIDSVIVGKALYEGRFTVTEALAASAN